MSTMVNRIATFFWQRVQICISSRLLLIFIAIDKDWGLLETKLISVAVAQQYISFAV